MRPTLALRLGAFLSLAILLLAAVIQSTSAASSASQTQTPTQLRSPAMLKKAQADPTLIQSEDSDRAVLEAVKSLTPAEIPAMLKRAEAGDGIAQLVLAIAYNHGLAVEQDYSQAAKWCQLAAEKGFARAEDLLGKLYFLGQGVPKDQSEALKWFQKAAQQGFADGQYDLGVMYLQGTGIPTDLQEARNWFLKAAEQWHTRAQVNLCAIYGEGKGVSRDLVAAAMWCVLAAGPDNQNESGSRALEQLSKVASAEEISEGRNRAQKWASDRIARDRQNPEAHQVTGTVVSLTEMGCFVLAQEVAGQKKEATYCLDMTDGILLSGEDTVTLIPPKGAKITIKRGAVISLEYRVEGDQNIVTSVKPSKENAPAKSKSKPKS